MDISMVYIIFFIFFSSIIYKKLLGFDNLQKINGDSIGCFRNSEMLKKLDFKYLTFRLILVFSTT